MPLFTFQEDENQYFGQLNLAKTLFKSSYLLLASPRKEQGGVSCIIQVEKKGGLMRLNIFNEFQVIEDLL